MSAIVKLTVILLAVTSTACSLTKQYPLETAALADTASTELAINQGYRELNPLGPAGAALGKLALITATHWMKESDREFVTHAGTSLWWGATVNNLSLTVGAGGLLAPVLGIATAVVLYMPKDNNDYYIAQGEDPAYIQP